MVPLQLAAAAQFPVQQMGVGSAQSSGPSQENATFVGVGQAFGAWQVPVFSPPDNGEQHTEPTSHVVATQTTPA
jgi:hypothetical protein